MDMKKKQKFFICWGTFWLFFLLLLGMGTDMARAEEQEQSRDIYVVYDTSGSMLYEKDDSAYPWYETGYALEMLAATLEDEDHLYIYFMKDDTDHYELKGPYGGSGYELQSRVDRIHEELRKIWYTGNTHGDGLMRAIEDIRNRKRDSQAFLVILSDGDFNYYEGEDHENDRSFVPELAAQAQERLGDRATVISVLLPSKRAITPLFPESAGKDYHVFDVKSSTGNTPVIFDVFAQMNSLIFKRQEVSWEPSGENGETQSLFFTAELPAHRLIVVGQAEGEGSAEMLSAADIRITGGEAIQTASGTISGLNVEDVKYDPEIMKNLQVTAGNYGGLVTIWKRDGKELLEAGTYEAAVPFGMDVNIYVEYDVAYQLILSDGETGTQWDILSEDRWEALLTGKYHLQVRLIDSLTGEILDPSQKTGGEGKSAYASFSVDLRIKNGGTVVELQDLDADLELTEGEFSVEGNIYWQGKSLERIEETETVRRRLGELRLQTDMPVQGLDLDQLGTHREGITVTVAEYNGEAWEQLAAEDYEQLAIQLAGNGGYEYTWEPQETGGWILYPERPDQVVVDEKGQALDSLSLTVGGMMEGQEVLLKEDCQVKYQAFPQVISFELEGADPTDYIGLFWRGIDIRPVILDNQMILLDDTAIEQLEWDFTAEEDTGLKGKMERTGTEAVEFHLSFRDLRSAWKLWRGGEIRGTVEVSCKRYGQDSAGETRLVMQIYPVNKMLRIVVYMLLTLMFYTLFMVAWKLITRCRLYGVRLEAYFNKQIGEKEYAREPLFIRKKRLRNFLHPFSAEIVIPLEEITGCGLSELIIIRHMGGLLQIKNIGQLLSNGNVSQGGRKLPPDGMFRLDTGIRLDIKGEYDIQIVLKKRGRLNEY